MIRLMVLTIFLANAKSILIDSKLPAATDGQIRFAIEQKYDHTGPGAQGPEYAYKTFKTLEEALVTYLDDPDTKLPDHERAKAYRRLIKDDKVRRTQQRYHPKPVDEYTGFKPTKQPVLVTRYSFPDSKVYYHDKKAKVGYLDLRGYDVAALKGLQSEVRPKKVQVIQKPFVLRDRLNDGLDQYDSNPKYSFSYGVHDKLTGDSKSAHESRDGGIVRGYYTFLDADGKQRTVRYTADGDKGFQATVERTQTNSQ